MPSNTMKKVGGVSLVFSKTNTAKKLQPSSAISEIKEPNNKDPDFVSALEDKKVHSSKGDPEETKEYVIPLIKKNLWKKQIDDKFKKIENKTEPLDSLETLAAQEIVEESAKQNEAWNERGSEDTNLAIPLLMQNQIPEGFETDDKLDVSLRPDAPQDTVYDEIPIEHFGKAMLRGMGWKEGDGIGKNKKFVSTIDAVIRPKGMGLGADKSLVQNLNQTKQNKQKDDENVLIMKKGSFCLVEKGSSKGLYGIVESIDEDNARVLVKLSISSNTITVSQYNIRLVTKKEFEKYSKYINKAKVDEYKMEEEKKKQQSSSSSRNGSSYSSHRSSNKRYSNEQVDHHQDSNHKKHKTENYHESNRNNSSMIWLRPQIRVRIISNSYKKGKYYKEKVVVEDILSIDNCICRTDSGKVLEGLSQQMLETVIPRAEPGVVMILSGKNKGMVAEVIRRDKCKCLATLQLMTDRDKIFKLDYDDISEYVGEVLDDY